LSCGKKPRVVGSSANLLYDGNLPGTSQLSAQNQVKRGNHNKKNKAIRRHLKISIDQGWETKKGFTQKEHAQLQLVSTMTDSLEKELVSPRTIAKHVVENERDICFLRGRIFCSSLLFSLFFSGWVSMGCYFAFEKKTHVRTKN
jgi:hypothetical protein